MGTVLVNHCPDCGAMTGDLYFHQQKECPKRKGLTNPYLNRLAAAGTNAHGKKSEKKVAKRMGARLHPNSGATRGGKSDASLKNFRLEMKSTVTQCMMLDSGWLVKIAQEALAHGQTPAVVVSFVNMEGTPRMSMYSDWVVIPMATFQELTHE